MKTPRKRHALATGIALAGVTAIAIPVTTALAEDSGSQTQDKASCEIKTLPGPNGNKSGSVSAISPDGKYLAGSADEQFVVWHEGEFTKLGEYAHVVDINSKGVAVGYGDYGDGKSGPWMWANGEFTGLEVPDVSGDAVEPSGINDSGVIVGNSGHNEDDYFISEVPLRWEAGSTKATELKLTEKTGRAGDISGDGKIVGSQHTGENGPVRPWLWGGSEDGVELPHTPEDEHGSAEPVQVSGDYALSSIGGPDSKHYMWDLSEPQVVEKPLEMVNPAGVDETGRAYGEDFEASEITFAVTESKDGIKQLPILKDEGELGEGDQNAVHAGSADGTLLGGAAISKDSTSSRAVVWTGCS